MSKSESDFQDEIAELRVNQLVINHNIKFVISYLQCMFGGILFLIMVYLVFVGMSSPGFIPIWAWFGIVIVAVAVVGPDMWKAYRNFKSLKKTTSGINKLEVFNDSLSDMEFGDVDENINADELLQKIKNQEEQRND